MLAPIAIRAGELMDDRLQFDKAEPAGTGNAAKTCIGCKMEIGDTYYLINDHITCPRCKDSIQEVLNRGSKLARFLRAVLYGTAAAALGAVIWYGILKLLNIEFGLIAVLVGVMVGVAVRKGSNGRGGWLYQGLAMFLTYSAIVVTYVPMIIDAGRNHPVEQTSAATQADHNATAQPQPNAVAAESDDVNSKPADQDQDDTSTLASRFSAQPKPIKLIVGYLFLFAIAFIVPFMAGFKNIIGLIIIGIGLYEAWKINRRRKLEVSGPFRVTMQGSAPNLA